MQWRSLGDNIFNQGIEENIVRNGTNHRHLMDAEREGQHYFCNELFQTEGNLKGHDH